MPQARGYMGRMALDYETTFGVSPTTKAAKILPFNSMEVAAKQNLIEPATLTGTRNPVQPGLGRISTDGSVAVPACYRSIGYWLKGLFGSPTTTGEAAPYTHVFKVTNLQPSMVLEKAFQDIGQYFLYNGCKVSTFKLPFGEDSELVATMDIMGSVETMGVAAYDAAATAVILNRINNPQATIKEGGVTTATVVSGDFTLNAGLDGNQYTVGSGNARGDIPEGLMGVSGTLKTLFVDRSYIDKGVNATKSSLELNFTNGTDSLNFLFPEIQYERTSPTITGPAGVQVDLNWRAFHVTDAANSAVVVTLVNDVAQY